MNHRVIPILLALGACDAPGSAPPGSPPGMPSFGAVTSSLSEGCPATTPVFSVLAGEDLLVSAVDLTDPNGKPMDEDNGFAVMAVRMDYPDAAAACASTGGTEHILQRTGLVFHGLEATLEGSQLQERQVVVFQVFTRGYFGFIVAEPLARGAESTLLLPSDAWVAL